MSQGYRRDYRESEQVGPAYEPMVWERVEWRQGDGRYTFEVAQGGLFATLTAPQGRALTLPVVAWEGLLDALAAARKTKSRAERNLPARTGARWSEAESGELAKAFKSGGSLAQLARIHNRTQFAIEAQLERLGLWDRAARQPIGRAAGRNLQGPSDQSGGEAALVGYAGGDGPWHSTPDGALTGGRRANDGAPVGDVPRRQGREPPGPQASAPAAGGRR
jgi:hypothetical protein